MNQQVYDSICMLTSRSATLKDGFISELDSRYKCLASVKAVLEEILSKALGEDDLMLWWHSFITFLKASDLAYYLFFLL